MPDVSFFNSSVMIGNLTRPEIEQMLNEQAVGRIGCSAEGRIWVVPVNFVYHDGYIYAHAREGQNLHILRTSPSICFEVDQVDSEDSWKSVLLWGKYEELRYPVRGAEGLKRLEERLHPDETAAAPSRPPLSRATSGQQSGRARKLIAFRIKISEISGRFELPAGNEAIIETPFFDDQKGYLPGRKLP
jgi:uncharacterized protein